MNNELYCPKCFIDGNTPNNNHMNIKKYYVTADIFSKTLLCSENNECLTLNVVHPVCHVLICVCVCVGVWKMSRG